MNLKMKLPRYTYDYDGLFFFSFFFLSLCFQGTRSLRNNSKDN